MCRKEAFLAGHSQCLNQHEKKLLPQWLKDIGGKEARRGWMWFLPCSFQTFSLALQTFLLFLTPLSPFHSSFFSYFLQGFHSFFPFLLPSVPTHSLPFLISSLHSLPSFVLFCPLPHFPFPSLSQGCHLPPCVILPACLVLASSWISLFLVVSLSASLFFLFYSLCLSCLCVCLVQSQELSFSTILNINSILFLLRHTPTYTPESVCYQPPP